MNKKLLVFLLSIISLVIGFLSGYEYVSINNVNDYSFTLNGKDIIKVGLDTTYNDNGATLIINDEDLSKDVKIQYLDEDFNVVNSIKTDVEAIYYVKYSFINDNNVTTIYRKIIVCELPKIDTDVYVDGDLQIHFLELGNAYTGDSIYIKAGNNDILIDAGSRKDSAVTLKNYIDNYCTDNKLEYVITTHAHQDHIAGMVGSNSGSTKTGILYQYDIDTIIDFALSDATSNIYNEYLTARDYAVSKGATHYTAAECFNEENGANKSYQLTSEISFDILYNYYYFNSAKSTDGGENNYSVCTLFKYKANSFLFTGDLEEDGEEKLAEYYTTHTGLDHVQLFKGGHHGSYTASNDCLLDIITPDICCVCSCVGTEEYGAKPENRFPAQAFIDRISKHTEHVYITSLINDWSTKSYTSFNGNIIVSSNGLNIGIQGSNNTIKLKDTTWFEENRNCPANWI